MLRNILSSIRIILLRILTQIIPRSLVETEFLVLCERDEVHVFVAAYFCDSIFVLGIHGYLWKTTNFTVVEVSIHVGTGNHITLVCCSV